MSFASLHASNNRIRPPRINRAPLEEHLPLEFKLFEYQQAMDDEFLSPPSTLQRTGAFPSFSGNTWPTDPTDQVMVNLQKQYDDVVARKVFLRRKRARIWNPRLPLFQLPFELLGYIIELCCTRTHTQLRPELVLSAVCQRFRQVALSSPQLWSYHSMRSDIIEPLELIELYFQRSSPRLVDFTLLIRGTPAVDRVFPLWDHVLRHSSYFRTMCIDILPPGSSNRENGLFQRANYHLIARITSTLGHYTFHNLLSLRFGLPLLEAAIGPQDFIRAESVPRLSELWLRNFQDQGKHLTSFINPLGSYIVRLVLDEYFPETLGHKLSKIRTLETLVLRIGGSPPPSSWVHIALPRLRSLRIDALSKCNQPLNFTEWFDTPNLQTLTLSSWSKELCLVRDKGSFPSITTLIIQNFAVDLRLASWLSKFGEGLRAIKHLVVVDSTPYILQLLQLRGFPYRMQLSIIHMDYVLEGYIIPSLAGVLKGRDETGIRVNTISLPHSEFSNFSSRHTRVKYNDPGNPWFKVNGCVHIRSTPRV